MIFGVRDIVDVCIKDITSKKPEIYLSNLKMSSFEFGATSVKAKGGRGNGTLIVWDGDKEIKFNCEDCIITPKSFSLLSGGTLATGVQIVPVTEVLEVVMASTPTITLSETIYTADLTTYPLFIFSTSDGSTADNEQTSGTPATANQYSRNGQVISLNSAWTTGDRFIATYYKQTSVSNKRITVTSDDFPATFELTGYTLWRNESDGLDYVCRIKISKAKLLSTFTLTQQPDSDPSTFNFDFEVMKTSGSNTNMVIFDIDEGASV